MKAEEIVLGGVYRCTGRGLVYHEREVVRIRLVAGVRMLSWRSVGGKNSGRTNEATFAQAALERLA